MTLVFVTSPFTHEHRNIREARAKEVLAMAQTLHAAKIPAYVPIVYGMAVEGLDGENDWEYWRRINEPILKASTDLLVLALPGWRTSRGVSAEIRSAKKLGKNIHITNDPYRVPGGLQ